MAARSSVDHRRLTRVLRSVAPHITEPVKGSLLKSGQTVLATMKAMVPVDQGVLRNNLSVKVSRGGYSVDVGIIGSRRQSQAFHGHFQEFGTVNHPAQPFVFPALEQHRQAIVHETKTMVDQALVKAARGDSAPAAGTVTDG